MIMEVVSSDFSVHKTKESRIGSIDFKNLDFGSVFADHQFEVDFVNGEWQNPTVKPFGPISVSPAMSVFHYGQAVFEGLKAFRYKGDKINVFRMDKNFERITRSCERLRMAAPEWEHFSEGIKTLIDLDRDWVPEDKYKALYIRPFVIATEAGIRMKASATFKFMIITSPVGNYYKEGINPVSLTTMPEFVRAVQGGTGAAKAAGNYAASLLPGSKAQANGFTQVLWLDALERKYIEEVGTMNILFVIDGKLVSPMLSGSILPGITRASVLQLARDRFGMEVEERRITIDEVFTASKEGRLQECFGAGTAAVISPVGSIHHQGNTIHISDEMGPIARKFYDTITGIQHGDVESPDGWCFLF
jgi:branched-chain amino acid aminotransferase